MAAVLLSGTAAGAPPEPEAGQRFKVLVDQNTVYSLGFEDLAAAGLASGIRPRTAGLGVTHRGRPVPIWIDDGRDGRLDPGDRIEFVGTHPAGEHSYFDPHTRYDVYYLELESAVPLRVAEPAAAECGAGAALVGVVRREENELRARFPGASSETDEIWYWARLSSAEREPLEIELELPGLDTEAAGPVSLALRFRGWSRLKEHSELFDHRVEVSLGDRSLGAAEWDNAPGGYSWQAPPIEPGRLSESGNRLRFRVPERRGGEAGDLIADASLLDWIEIRYPLAGVPARGSFWVATGDGERGCIPARPGGSAIHSPAGARLAPNAESRPAGTGWEIPPSAGGDLVGPFLVADGRSAAAVRIDTPSHLAANGQGADYLVVAHGSLVDAIGPLVEFHESRGLRVVVADVEDVYDEFSDGIPSPTAIRDFVRHAYLSWRRPAPRFLLLVGDASWDPRHDELRDENYADWTFRGLPGTSFVKNESTSLESPAGRGLLPTWSSPTYEGDAANDNYFVAVDGDDELPELAVGRFPAATPDEVRAMVEKTIAQHRAAPGPWRRRVLWLANEQQSFQRRSDRLMRYASTRGLVSTRIYPEPDEPSYEKQQAAIRNAFDEGQALVHFVGHGGRYIWRTGPPDIKKNRDLFTLDDLDALAPRSALPIVLSMTCYSAPFDHPTADSIGEKLLRMPGRGAAAVIAASWRNSPTQRVDFQLVEEVMSGGTVGEALQRTKREARNPDFVRQYNLLGDPALPVPFPAPGVEVELVGGGAAHVRGRVVPEVTAARAVVEWTDREGLVLYSTDAALSDGVVEAGFGGSAEDLARVDVVRVYAWSGESGEPGAEAIGAVSLSSEDLAPGGPGRRGGQS